MKSHLAIKMQRICNQIVIKEGIDLFEEEIRFIGFCSDGIWVWVGILKILIGRQV